MKKSEKIFLAINNIDERLIDEAKGKDEKPVLIRVEKHMPVKEVIAFAACFAVLATGIYALIKFKINGIDPMGNTSSEISANSFVLPSEFTEEDLELQNILEQLSPGEELRNRFLYGFDGTEYTFTFNYDPEFDGSYILVPAGKSQSGLMYPQTRDEMFKLLLKYFTFNAADSFMDEVQGVAADKNPDGTYSVISIVDASFPTFIATKDGMYRRKAEAQAGGAVPLWNTARVISKTEDSIKFSYVIDETGEYRSSEGLIKLERGGWRLNYCRDGFELEDDLPVMVKDKEFPNIVQPFMEQGSFEDALRHIILTAESVEELESNIKAFDTENRVIEIKVTERSSEPQYYKTGKPVTEGAIVPGVTALIFVTYDDEFTGLVCSVGSLIDFNYGDIWGEGEFADETLVRIADTVTELKQLIEKWDVNERVTAVHVYRNLGEGKREEVTDGALEIGMGIRIEYDLDSYLDISKNDSVQLT